MKKHDGGMVVEMGTVPGDRVFLAIVWLGDNIVSSCDRGESEAVRDVPADARALEVAVYLMRSPAVWPEVCRCVRVAASAVTSDDSQIASVVAAWDDLAHNIASGEGPVVCVPRLGDLLREDTYRQLGLTLQLATPAIWQALSGAEQPPNISEDTIVTLAEHGLMEKDDEALRGLADCMGITMERMRRLIRRGAQRRRP